LVEVRARGHGTLTVLLSLTSKYLRKYGSVQKSYVSPTTVARRRTCQVRASWCLTPVVFIRLVQEHVSYRGPELVWMMMMMMMMGDSAFDVAGPRLWNLPAPLCSTDSFIQFRRQTKTLPVFSCPVLKNI